MNKFWNILILILFFSVTYAQEIKVDSYWLKSDKEKAKINQEQFEEHGIIALDSITVEKIRSSLIQEKEIFVRQDSVQVIYSPFVYQIKSIIADSLNNVGVYRIRFASSHAQTFIVFKEESKLDILYDYKQYRYQSIVNTLLGFIGRYENRFSAESKIKVWKNLSDVLWERYNYTTGYD